MNQTAMNNATNIMHQLYDQGLLKRTEEAGQVVPVESFEEYQQVRVSVAARNNIKQQQASCRWVV